MIRRRDWEAPSAAAHRRSDTQPTAPQQRDSALEIAVPPTNRPLTPKKQAREASEKRQEQWSEAICRNMDLPKGYSQVAVLLIKWADDLDDRNTVEEMERLTSVFRDDFHYATVTVSLNEKSAPQDKLINEITGFLKHFDGPNNLLIIYYTGHAGFNRDSGGLELYARNPSEGTSGVRHADMCARWDVAESFFLENTEADTLAVLDTCYEGNVTKGAQDTERAYQLLATSEPNRTTAGPGHKSFNAAMIESLTECLHENGDKPFSVLQKYERLIELAPLKEKGLEKDGSRMSLMQKAGFADLTLRFTLGSRLLTTDHIEKLTRELPKAFQAAELGLQGIHWEGFEARPSVDFKGTVSAIRLGHRWLHKTFPDRKSIDLQETSQNRTERQIKHFRATVHALMAARHWLQSVFPDRGRSVRIQGAPLRVVPDALSTLQRHILPDETVNKDRNAEFYTSDPEAYRNELEVDSKEHDVTHAEAISSEVIVNTTLRHNDHDYSISNAASRILLWRRFWMDSFSLVQRFLPLLLFEAPIPLGMKRIRWTCKCGANLYDDFIEVRPGALGELRDRLHYVTSSNTTPGAGTEVRGQPLRDLDTSAPLQTGVSSSDESTHKTLPSGGPETADTIICIDEDAQFDGLHVLCSINKGAWGVKLYQRPLEKVNSDHELMMFFRQLYHQYRGRLRPWWSLRAVCGIELVKVIMDMNSFVNLGRHEHICERSGSNGPRCQCVPPPERIVPSPQAEYICEPVEPEIFPPVGSNYMMHYFSSPSECHTGQRSILNQLPKRMDGELESDLDRAKTGWGVYFCEGWDKKKVFLIIFFCFILPGLTFAFLWSGLKGDIQGAWGIAACWLTLAGMILGALQFYAPDFA